MKLLLINPRAPESFWSFRWALDTLLPAKRAVNPPLGLATLAALCPPSWEVQIVDENVESVPLAPQADLIGICGMGVQFARQRELLTYFREHGYFVVAGGSFASLCPERYADLADCVVAGEAEYIWPAFCVAFESGSPQRLYRETGVVSLLDSPTPRFDLLRLDRYVRVTLQFSRGCPFRCEFCDIIVMFGRKPRTKSIVQIEGELDALRALGAHNLFFVDDNFIGNRPQARQLLSAIASYQRRHRHPFRFGTEASINLAQDEEMMDLFHQAHFDWVFIGIESPDEEALIETGKTQNLREDMLVSLRRIYAHGIDVFAGFIVGFDHDTAETFERQRAFIMKSGIQVAMVGLLTALPRTPFYERLHAEGRLLDGEDGADNTRLGTNVIPKRMTMEALRAGYEELYRRLCSHRGIADRIQAKLGLLKRPRGDSGRSLTEQAKIVARFFLRGIRPGGWSRWWHFLRTVAIATPRQLSFVIAEWIAGLSMKSYAERFVVTAPELQRPKLERYVERLRAKLRVCVAQEAVEIGIQHIRDGMPHLSFTVKRPIDGRAIARAARNLRRVLRKTQSTLTLRIEQFDRDEIVRLQCLLKRLRRYGDRISISVADALRETIEIDSSRFHLVLQHTPE